MGCNQTKTELEALIAEKEAQLNALNTAYTKALTNGNVAEYSFNSADAFQKTKYRSLKDLREGIAYLEAEISNLKARLNGCSIITMTSSWFGGYCSGSFRSI